MGHIDPSGYQSATTTEIPGSSNETRCASSALAFVQNRPNRPAGHGPLLQANTTPSITDITGLLRTMLPRAGRGLVRAPGFLGDTQGTSNQTCCVGSSHHFNTITRSSATATPQLQVHLGAWGLETTGPLAPSLCLPSRGSGRTCWKSNQMTSFQIISFFQAHDLMCLIQGNVCEVAVLGDLPCNKFLFSLIVAFLQHLSFFFGPSFLRRSRNP